MKVKIAIVGGGPAGTGPVLKAMKDGTIKDFVAGGIAIIEAGPHLLAGSLAKYKVNSDTLSDVFLECLDGHTEKYLKLSQLEEEVKFIRTYKGRSVPLPALQKFLVSLGEMVLSFINQQENCRVLINTRALRIVRKDNTGFVIHTEQQSIEADYVIVASGGIVSDTGSFNGEVNLMPYAGKTMSSDDLIQYEWIHEEDHFLKNLSASPRITILGGNHSAFSCADYLLRKTQFEFRTNPISIVANRRPKIFFSSQEDALQSGYTEFTSNDICPLTGRVFRLAGLRMDGRSLYMKMLGMNGESEKRVRLLSFENAVTLNKQLINSDLIITAFGYTFNMLPLEDEAGNSVTVFNNNGHWVNSNCQMRSVNGEVIQGLYAVGLGVGFIPSGKLGGEAGFSGQTNGLWYYQNETAKLLLEQICTK